MLKRTPTTASARAVRRCLVAASASLGIAAWPMVVAAQLADYPNVSAARRSGAPLTPSPKADWNVPALGSIDSRATFATIDRVYHRGTPREIDHTPFVVDRLHGDDKVYYVNSNRYALHEDFVRGQYLVDNLDRKALAASYSSPTRRFVFGTIGFRSELQRWTFEFWEGDKLTAELLRTTAARLAATFFAPVAFKANSAQQEAVGTAAGIETITEVEILGRRSYLSLNNGSVKGRLRLVADIESETEDDIEPYDIVVLRDVPLAIPPVAGVITERPSTVLSHVNLLAKGWGIPNAYVRDAFAAMQAFDGRWVRLQVGDDAYRIEPIEAPTSLPIRPKSGTVRAPELGTAELQPLERMRSASAAYCGAKASTLGQIESDRRRGLIKRIAEVPDGFCIPYAEYAKFTRRDEVRARVDAALASDGFERSRVVRRKALEALRRDLLEMPVDAAAAAAWVARWRSQLAGKGVFVRSSSNAEDLPNFSGAGLFSTVPNVTRDADLVRAVKTVWASVYNFEAYEARRHAGIASADVYMGVFVQTAIDSVTSGVMITRDPFDRTRRDVVYVSAKRGIGIKVVEGRRVAEQSMLNLRSGAVRRLSRSAETSALQLDAGGGVVDTAIAADRDVLSDATVRSLAEAGQRLKALLGNVDQDIEWATDPSGRVVILQSRPFIEAKAF